MMVSPGIVLQGTLFVQSMVLGVVMIFCYDLLRIFRRGVPHGTVWIAVEDMFFWLICAFVLFQLMYEKMDGKIRCFVILGAFLGMVLYSISLSSLVVRFGSFLLRWILHAAGTVFRAFGKVLQILCKPFGKCVQHTRRVSKKSNRYVKKQLKKIWKTVKMGLYKL